MIAVSLRPAAEGPGGAAAVVTVQRGLWGSTPRAHGANASVLAPIYHSKGGWPEGGSGHVRYALDQSRLWVAQYNAAAVGTTACKRSLSLAGLRRSHVHRCPAVPQYSNPELLDGLWLDCMGVLGFQSHDACGGPIQFNFNSILIQF